MARLLVFFILSFSLFAEVHNLTLRAAVDLAARQNPEIVMARIEEQKALEAVRMAHDPFTPRIVVGSGLAYTVGFPMSIEGSAPSIFQARAIQTLYNKPKSYEVAAARETARGATIDTTARREDVAHRTATLYLDAQNVVRSAEATRQLVAANERVLSSIEARVNEGRELPIEARRAALRIAQAKQRLADLEAARDYMESALAVILGFPPDDRVNTSGDDSPVPAIPTSEEESVNAALANNKDVQKLESAMQARGLEARGARSQWLPQIDLIAQYALFGKYNNYEDYFQRFARNNAQLGASITVPIFPGRGGHARASQADLEVIRLRTQANAVRDRVTLDTRKAWSDLGRAESARELAKLDLEVTREQLSVLLAQSQEGRVSVKQVEDIRALETEKFLALYDAIHKVDIARLNLLRYTGELLAALK